MAGAPGEFVASEMAGKRRGFKGKRVRLIARGMWRAAKGGRKGPAASTGCQYIFQLAVSICYNVFIDRPGLGEESHAHREQSIPHPRLFGGHVVWRRRHSSADNSTQRL